MFGQPQHQDNRRAVGRTLLRFVTGWSPATAILTRASASTATAAINTSRADTSEARHKPGGSRGELASDPGARYQGDDVIVGHWLANGHMSIHAPGQPCGLCANAPVARARRWVSGTGYGT